MKSTKIFRKPLLLIMAVAMMSLIIPFSASASGEIVHDANKWSVFSSRTKADIVARYKTSITAGASYSNGYSSTYYQTSPSLVSPYSGGRLTADTHTAMTAKTNYYRWLVGVSPLKSGSTHTTALQGHAAIQHVYAFSGPSGLRLTHNLKTDWSKPADMAQSFWDNNADAAHNIIAVGYSPRSSITGWLAEGYSLSSKSFDTIGHRMALIGSKISGLDFGYAGLVANGNIKGMGNTTSLEYVAYPSPGYFPLNELPVNYSAWNIEVNTNKIDYISVSDVSVKVTNLKTNTSYICTAANGRLAGSYYFVDSLMFAQPSSSAGSLYADGDKFKVEVTGLFDVKTYKAVKLVYTTEFFDVEKAAAKPTTGWKTEGSSTVYYNANGNRVTGWQTIGGKTFYFDKSGKMLTGWQTINGKTFFFKRTGANGTKGYMHTGWNTIDGKKFFFKRTGANGTKGYMHTGWNTIDGKKFFFKRTGANGTKGYLHTGWNTIDGKKFFFKRTGANGTIGHLHTGWNTIDGKKFFFKRTGANGTIGHLHTGWNTIDGKKFFFKRTGANGTIGQLHTGWNTIDGKKYYFKKTGANGTIGHLHTGWHTIGGKKFYFKKTGANGTIGQLLTGWHTLDGKRYYLKKTGANGEIGKMLNSGWYTISSKRYYFDSKGVYIPNKK